MLNDTIFLAFLVYTATYTHIWTIPTIYASDFFYDDAPSLVPLILTSTFLVLLPVASHISTLLTNTDLLGPLTLGILFCSPSLPPPAPLLPPSYLPFLSFLGYLGLLLLIFDAGLSTPVDLLLDFRNLGASLIIGLTGIIVPIALSLALFYGAFGYTPLTAFAAGASLCSTSLGTTVSLLSGDMKKSRVGAVLMSAALFDDVVGLVIAGVIGNLAPGSEGGVRWSTIVRPVLVSLAFALGTPILANLARMILRYPGRRCAPGIVRYVQFLKITRTHVNLFVIVITLMGFVATSYLAGTSERFGAYLAGAFLAYVFEPQVSSKDNEIPNPILTTFTSHLSHILLHPLLSPLFFASIGASIPVNQLFTIHLPSQVSDLNGTTTKSHRVVWRGVVYSLLMVLGKTITGVWVFAFWKKERVPKQRSSEENGSDNGQQTPPGPLKNAQSAAPITTATPSGTPSRLSTALLLGLAMVARGEIALIVAQLARPLLVGTDGTSEEPFVIVMWAILITTFAGAFGVGLVTKGMRGT